jgi:hypothetical protein
MYRDRYTKKKRRHGKYLDNTGYLAIALPKQVRYQAALHPDAWEILALTPRGSRAEFPY